MTLHNAGSSACFNMALKREGKKEKKKRKRSYYLQHRVFVFGDTHPSTNPAEQGLTLLSGQDMVLSLLCSDSNFFISNKKR